MPPRTDACGTSECPIKGCSETVEVFKYRERSPGDSTKRRFAGRLYCVCQKHGRVENQEFLLEHITWKQGAPAASTAQVPPAPVKPTPAPVTPPAPRPLVAPVKREPAAPVATRESPRKPNGWLPNFWSDDQ